MKPIPRVSAKKYPSENRPATVRFRVKGEADGPVYQGQQLVRPCKDCGQKRKTLTNATKLRIDTPDTLWTATF